MNNLAAGDIFYVIRGADASLYAFYEVIRMRDRHAVVRELNKTVVKQGRRKPLTTAQPNVGEFISDEQTCPIRQTHYGSTLWINNGKAQPWLGKPLTAT